MPLKRPCSRCNRTFLPTGKVCKLCPKCWKEAQTKSGVTRKKNYWKENNNENPHQKRNEETPLQES